MQGVIRLVSSLDRESNDLLVIQLEAIDDGTDPGPQTGYASVSCTALCEIALLLYMPADISNRAG